MSYIFTHEFITPMGTLILGEFDDKLCLCDWKFRSQRLRIDNRLREYFNTQFLTKETEMIREAKHQLNKYFNAESASFDIPIVFAGTEFQKKVWSGLFNIPYGSCITYEEFAKSLGNPEAIRAVASANGANAISIIVPCHRVIGENGNLVGYAGGLDAKQKLLTLEGYFDRGQLNLFE